MGKFRDKNFGTDEVMVRDANVTEKGVTGAHIFPW